MSAITIDATGAERFRYLTAAERRQVARILRLVSAAVGIPVDDIQGRVRTARIAGARQLAMVLVQHTAGISGNRTGQVFDRDHATVLHAHRAVAAKRSTDAAFNRLYLDLITQEQA